MLLARPTTFGCGPCIYKQINPFGVDLRTILTSTTQTRRVWVVRYVFTAWPLTGPGHSKKILYNTDQPLRVDLCNAINPYGLIATFKIINWDLCCNKHSYAATTLHNINATTAHYTHYAQLQLHCTILLHTHVTTTQLQVRTHMSLLHAISPVGVIS